MGYLGSPHLDAAHHTILVSVHSNVNPTAGNFPSQSIDGWVDFRINSRSDAVLPCIYNGVVVDSSSSFGIYLLGNIAKVDRGGRSESDREAMEKAINRQRVLLQHLQPSTAASSHLISVIARPFFLSFPISISSFLKMLFPLCLG